MAASVRQTLSELPAKAARPLRELTSHADRHTLNQALGWFSLGLGLTQIFAPKALGRAIGVGDHPVLMRLCGAREVAAGIGLLSGRAPTTFAMARVVGDAMDLAVLGASLASPRADRNRIAVAATAVAGVAALDVYASKLDLKASIAEAPRQATVRVSLVINSPPDRLYEFWRKLDNLPRFMKHLESVEIVDERLSRWTAVGPAKVRAQWESEIVDDRANEFISWRTRPGSEVHHQGSVRFEPAVGGRGTVVRVELTHGAPNGALASKAVKLLGAAPEAAIREDLRRLKQLMESGEIATTRGQPSGARSLIGKTLARSTRQEAQ